MDFLFSWPTLTTVFIVWFMVIAYGITIIRKDGSKAYLARLGQMVKGAAVMLINLAASLIGLLATSTKTSDSTEATANAARGGVLNHRTGKFDDGTDPAGWYEND